LNVHHVLQGYCCQYFFLHCSTSPAILWDWLR
jgi:hypothetical protein